MARTKAADHEQQRDRILNTAVHAFANVGYPSASMAELARLCSTSKAGLYHYYASKEALLFDALDRYTRRLLSLAQSVCATERPATQTLRDLIRAFMTEYQNAQAYHVALLNDVKFLAEPERLKIRAQERAVVQVFSELIGRAYPQRTAGDRLMPITMALLGMINFTFAWLDPNGPMNDRQFADLAIELWEHGLNGDQALPRAMMLNPKSSVA
jgi:AcrR family transcriptional regulator